MIGTVAAAAIGAATSIANGIFGAASARKQQREQQAAIDKQRAEERAWFNRRYNEDATQRADAQRMLTRANEEIKKRSLAAAGKKAVIGGTDASQAAVQQANAESMGNAVSEITARADARKDSMEQNHRQRMSSLDAQEVTNKANAEAAKRQAMAQAATGVVNSAASVIGNLGEDGGNAKAKATTPTTQAKAPQTNTAMAQEAWNNLGVNTTPNIQQQIKALKPSAPRTLFDMAREANENIGYDPYSGLQQEVKKNVKRV